MTPPRADEASFRGVFDAHPDPMWVVDAATLRFLEVNEAAITRYGHTAEAFRSLSLPDLVPDEDLSEVPADWTGTWRHRLADGGIIDVDVKVRPLEFHGRHCAVVVAENVTERKQAEAALRSSEAQQRAVVDAIRQVIFRTDPRGRFTFLNAAWTEITGFSASETLGTGLLGYVHPDDRQAHAEAFQPLLADRDDFFACEARYLTRAGGFRWIEVYAQVMMDPGAGVRGLFGTLTDITERKRAEDEVAAARARLDHLLVSSPTVILSSEPWAPYSLTFLSDNIARLLGYTPREVLEAPRFWEERLHPKDAAEVLAAMAALVERPGEHHAHQRYRFRASDGEYRWIHDERRLVRDAEGRPAEIVGSWTDFTRRRAAEDDRARLGAVVEQAGEAIAITDHTGHIEYVNPAFERLTGYTSAEILGRSPRFLESDKQDPKVVDQIRATLAAGQTWSGRLVNRRKDGTLFECDQMLSPIRDAAGAVVSYAGILRDVTRERQMEAELLQSQKMETAGRLAGGIAHDFNNLVTIITGRSHLLLQRLAPDDPKRRDVQLMEETARRAADLTRQLLVFSRKQVLAPQVIDINEIVAGMGKMLRPLIGEDIELVTRLGNGLARIKADPGQLEQVIVNLAVNARDAMPAGGRLLIETSEVQIGMAEDGPPRPLPPGVYVALSVTDTGCGIPDDVKPHIFEPFFTTKPQDRGTGLGLSTVYGIVKQSDGDIVVETEPGKGTTFRVYLPRVNGETAVTGTRADTAVPRGSQTVLLAEDQDEVRAVVRQVLGIHGYTVLEAEHGPAALALSAQHPGPIHLLLTDVVMPHMSGRELAEAILQQRPDTRVLYMSGYTDDAVLHHHVRVGEVPFIAKPFSPRSLAGKVHEILTGQVAAPSDATIEAHGATY